MTDQTPPAQANLPTESATGLDGATVGDAASVSDGAGATNEGGNASARAPATPPVVPRVVEPFVSPFRFTGDAKAYFRIWIVNLFLTIITLGIYSAWAKVRKKRYFYSHTWVAGANFEYHGDPIAILKGRLIAAAAVAVYYGVGHFMPKLAIAIAFGFFIAAPWLIARSMAFNAFNSSYRNLRFRFAATYMDVLKAIWPLGIVILLPIFAPEWNPHTTPKAPTGFWVVFGVQFIAFALAYPYAVGSVHRLRVNRSGYGSAQMRCEFWMERVYGIYATAMILLVLAMLALGFLATVGGAVLAMTLGKAAAIMPVLVASFFVFCYLVVSAVGLGYTKSRIGNLIFGATTLDERITFYSALRAKKLAGLYVTNMLGVVLTLGLAIPWAAIRVARYRAERLELQSNQPIEDIVGSLHADVAATGEELGEFFNVDISL